MYPPFLQPPAIVNHAICDRARKLLVSLVILLPLIAACTSAEAHTISGRVSGSWQCVNMASSAAPITITLLPLDREVVFTRTVPEFSFRNVPDGRYTLRVSCSGIPGREYPEVPVTVSGANATVGVVLPFPTLPQSTPIATLVSHSQPIDSLAFTPDSSMLVSASKDGTVTQWNLTTGEKLKTFRHGITSPDGSLALSADGTMLASGAEGGTIKLWDVEAGKVLHTLSDLDGRVEGLAFSTDGTTLAGWQDWHGNQVALWDTTTGNHLRTLNMGPSQRIWWARRSVALMQNGAVLVSAVEADRVWAVQWWDVTTGNRFKSLTLPSIAQEEGLLGVISLAVSPDESRFALGMGGFENVGGLLIWNVSTGDSTATGYERGLSHVEFSPDGTQVASTTYDNTVVLWDGITGEANYVLVSDSRGIDQTAWSADGKMLAAGDSEGSILLWETP